MDYKNYRVEDFVLDKQFRKWILEDNKDLNDFWSSWIREHPEKSEVLSEARNILLQIPDTENEISDEKIAAIWDTVEQTIDEKKDPKQAKLVPLNSHAVLQSFRHSYGYKRQRNMNIYWRIAIILVLVVGGVLFWMSKQDFRNDIANPPNELMVKQNPWGQKSHIFLNDGSEVMLNAGSTLKYNKYFDADKRILELEGEAYLKVEKDPSRPFIVKTANMSTTALGTEFNVRAYRNEPASVVLVHGKVKVAKQEGSDAKWDDIILMPGEGVEFNNDGGPEKFNFNEKEYLSWKEGTLYFNNASEEEVYGKLEKWYGVNIVSENRSPKEWGYTGEFYDKSLETVLISLSYAMDFTYEVENDKVKILYNKPQSQ